MATPEPVRTPSRSADKRAAMMAAATRLFLQKGFSGTSMDDIAAQAAVSKQTVYKHFADKDQLFREIVLQMTERAETFVHDIESRPWSGDLEADLRGLARDQLATVLQPELLQFRRLVIGEADRFPDLAAIYYERGPGRVLATFAAVFSDLAEQGKLQVDDADLAANHFAWLVLGAQLDRSMFYGLTTTRADHLGRYGDEAVRVFLSAYAPRRGETGPSRQASATRKGPSSRKHA
jgi:TetR/AcrR family transcriptional regulator, mexJK operon transcriptional repressor